MADVPLMENPMTAVADSIIGGASGAPTRLKNNLSASVAPAVTDDSGDGYAIGSVWIDTTADKAYVATDVSVGAAVWKETTASGASLGAWTTYVPTWTATAGTQPTLGNGTLTGRYKALDANTYAFHISLVAGSTTTYGDAGIFNFALPATAVSGQGEQIVVGHLLNSGTDSAVCIGRIASGGTVIYQIVPEASNAFGFGSAYMNSTGDRCDISGVFEV